MTPSPIGKVLSTIRKHRVRALLMGGQACILYGAAEFSRDVDLVLLAEEKNLDRLRRALAELRAESVYVPSLSVEVLRRGHACHFRIPYKSTRGFRIDVMSRLHGCDAFPMLWRRRKRLTLPGVGEVNVLSLPDLVRAKKTMRDKDWPMIRRLVEADYHNRPPRPARPRVLFWLAEARSPELLTELCQSYPRAARQVAKKRAAVTWALKGRATKIQAALQAEETIYRNADRAYWQPLRAELFQWRQERREHSVTSRAVKR